MSAPSSGTTLVVLYLFFCFFSPCFFFCSFLMWLSLNGEAWDRHDIGHERIACLLQVSIIWRRVLTARFIRLNVTEHDTRRHSPWVQQIMPVSVGSDHNTDWHFESLLFGNGGTQSLPVQRDGDTTARTCSLCRVYFSDIILLKPSSSVCCRSPEP